MVSPLSHAMAGAVGAAAMNLDGSSGGAEAVSPVVGMLWALVQSFLIIGLGYAMRAFNVFSDSARTGVSLLIVKVTLPSLLFVSMASINLQDVNWYLLGALGLGKLIVFAVVALVCAFASRSPGRVALAGIYAIFSTQSNDFAFGLPIVTALFPSLVPYLFLAAPIQLCILNPIGFLLMEAGSTKNQQGFSCKTVMRIFANVATNPVVASTFLGLLYNLLNYFVHAPLPNVIASTLTTMGNGFPVVAQMALGMGMYGNLSNLKGRQFAAAIGLSFLKTIVVALAIRLMASMLQPDATSDQLNFAYLYGIFPTAPSVYGFAVQYGASPELVASSSVLCTLLSAPLLYIATSVLAEPAAIVSGSIASANAMSVVSIIGCLWIVVIFIRFPFRRQFAGTVILWLAVSMMAESILELIDNSLLDSAFSSLALGVYLAKLFFTQFHRLWVDFLAWGYWRCLVTNGRFSVSSWGLVGIAVICSLIAGSLIAAILIFLQQNSSFPIGSDFRYGYGQIKGDAITVTIDMVIVMVFLVLTERYVVQANRSLNSESSGINATLISGDTPDDTDDMDDDTQLFVPGGSARTTSVFPSTVRSKLMFTRFRFTFFFAWMILGYLFQIAIDMVYLLGSSLRSGAILQLLLILEIVAAASGAVLGITFGLDPLMARRLKDDLNKVTIFYRRVVLGAQDATHLVLAATADNAECGDLLCDLLTASQLVHGHRATLLQPYQLSVRGQDFVSWLLANRRLGDRTTATRLGQAFVTAGLLQPISAALFEDGTQYYALISSELAVPEGVQAVVDAILDRTAGVLRTTTHRGNQIANSATGEDLVTWLVENRHAPSRVEAQRVLRRACFYGLVCHFNNRFIFSDDRELYVVSTGAARRPAAYAPPSDRYP